MQAESSRQAQHDHGEPAQSCSACRRVSQADARALLLLAMFPFSGEQVRRKLRRRSARRTGTGGPRTSVLGPALVSLVGAALAVRDRRAQTPRIDFPQHSGRRRLQVWCKFEFMNFKKIFYFRC